jgi:hypothetical protein
MSTTSLGYTNGAIRGSDHWPAVTHNHELGLFSLTGDQGSKALNIHPI